MEMACLDLEGVLVPEIWINVAERCAVPELQATTRDIPDYDQLMQQRLRLLKEHRISLPMITDVIAGMGPMEGAREFLDWLRERFQVVILSDTFYEFAKPLMRQLGYPTLLCHRLEADKEGWVTAYHLRQPDQKRHAVAAFQNLRYRVIVAGDSFNDTAMLSQADAGIFFNPPPHIIEQFPQFPVTADYQQLRKAFCNASTLVHD